MEQKENQAKNRYVIDWEEYARIAREAAAEGAVLLKNDGKVLPLKEGEKLSVFGRIQFDYYKSGTGSGGLINTRYVVGILDALKEEKLELNGELEQIYRDWLKDHPFERGYGWAQEPWSQQEMPLEKETVENAARKSDAALVIIGRTAGEDRDILNEKGSYALSEEEEQMIKLVCAAFDKVIVALNVGNIIDMSWLETYHPQAVLYVWQGGMEGGHAVADVLMGRVNPCGKLSDTIARFVDDYPSTKNFGSAEGNQYQEDIYVGYRYFETFDSAKKSVLYPFGFGLSYTSFEMNSTMKVNEDGCVFAVKVQNTGERAGKEVVQVYVNAPQGMLGKPARVLAAFAKTKCLEPGEEQELTLEAKNRVFASYDDSGVTGHPFCYVLEAGTYRFYIGSDVRSAKLAGDMEVSATRVLEQCTQVLAPVEAMERMKPVPEGDQGMKLSWESAPIRTTRVSKRYEENPRTEIPYTGDKGYKLSDVYDKKVSLEEFVGQLSDQDMCCLVRGEGMCSPKVTPGTASAFGGVTASLESYGIPCACCADGPSGIRMDCGAYAFSLPNGTCLACSFNEELMERLYEMEGAEMRKNRVDVLLGPGMNIHRNPLNGRNFEYFSEDPFLTGKMAAAQLRGMGKYQVTGTLKHFATNNQEFHRKFYRAVVSERALREIYLKGFEIAVKESDVYAVMTTYGAINGLFTASNYELLTTVLREEWHFDGFVMTDWWADMNDEGGEPSNKNAAAMIRSQNDIYMVTPSSEQNTTEDNLEESLQKGTLRRADLQLCAMNLLKAIMRSPVMDRSLGRLTQEELEAAQVTEEEDLAETDVQWYPLKDKLELDGKDIDTGKGSAFVCGLRTEEKAAYQICFRAKVDASELAQVSVSVFLNGTLRRTVTLNGTGGKYVEIKHMIGHLRSANNYLKLYFSESGMQIDKIEIERVE